MAIPVVVLATATALAYSADRRAAGVADVVEHSYQVHLQVRDVLDDLVDSETGTRGFMLTGDGAFLAPYERGAHALPDDLAGLTALVRGNRTQTDNLGRLAPLITERMDLLRRQQAISPITTRSDRQRAGPMLHRGNLLMTGIRDVLGHMESLEEEALRTHQGAQGRADAIANILRFGVLPLGVLFSLLLVLASSGRTVRRILRIEENARRLESGDALREADPSRDEIGTLSRLLVAMGERLRHVQDELRHLATTDPLTGVANRRGFLLIAEHQLELARRDGRAYELAFIDVDGLKQVNDRLGHQQGDLMLQEIAALVRDTVRSADVVARVGGDEFCVLVAADTERDARTAISRIESTVQWANRLPGRDYPVSISVGSARFEGTGRETIEELMNRADRAMYERKRAKLQGDVAERAG